MNEEIRKENYMMEDLIYYYIKRLIEDYNKTLIALFDEELRNSNFSSYQRTEIINMLIECIGDDNNEKDKV